MKKCDHSSVGMLVWAEGKLLLIERGREPFGFAVPAGHVDSDASYEIAAARELKEEVGLDTVNLQLVAEGRKENKCRREDGSWHYWKVYKVEISGELHRSLEETKQAKWFSKEEIMSLAKRTEDYLSGNISEAEWEQKPGLEPVMYEWFKQLEIV